MSVDNLVINAVSFLSLILPFFFLSEAIIHHFEPFKTDAPGKRRVIAERIFFVKRAVFDICIFFIVSYLFYHNQFACSHLDLSSHSFQSGIGGIDMHIDFKRFQYTIEGPLSNSTSGFLYVAARFQVIEWFYAILLLTRNLSSCKPKSFYLHVIGYGVLLWLCSWFLMPWKYSPLHDIVHTQITSVAVKILLLKWVPDSTNMQLSYDYCVSKGGITIFKLTGNIGMADFLIYASSSLLRHTFRFFVIVNTLDDIFRSSYLRNRIDKSPNNTHTADSHQLSDAHQSSDARQPSDDHQLSNAEPESQASSSDPPPPYDDGDETRLIFFNADEVRRALSDRRARRNNNAISN